MKLGGSPPSADETRSQNLKIRDAYHSRLQWSVQIDTLVIRMKF